MTERRSSAISVGERGTDAVSSYSLRSSTRLDTWTCTRCSMRRKASVEREEPLLSSCSMYSCICRTVRWMLYRSTDRILTDCAKTRWRKTCMTSGGFGNTTWTICASSPTVARISLNNCWRPFSVLGGVESGSFSVFQLQCHGHLSIHRHHQVNSQFGVRIEVVNLADSVYKEVVLVDVYLNARSTAIEVL